MSIRSVSYATMWDPELLAWARRYATLHGLTVRAVLNAALAEYAARREQTKAPPAPQLHFRRGHPPSSTLERQRDLVRVDPRGRRWRRDDGRAVAAASQVDATADARTRSNRQGTRHLET